MDLINSSYSRNINLSVNYKYVVNDKLLMKSFVFYKRGVANLSQMEIGSSFEYNRNPIDIIGNTTVTITQKMKYTAIIIDPFIMEFGLVAFSNILPCV